MKKLVTFAAICLTATLVGCQTTSDMGVSPAAVSECGVNCESSACCAMEKTCSDDCMKACCSKSDTSYGAMGTGATPSGCGAEMSSGCSSCPYSSKKNNSM